MGKIIVGLMVLWLPVAVSAGEPVHSLASTLEVYVFPADGQDSSQQSRDEAACYQWAEDNTGVDPFNLAKEEESDKELAEAEMEAAQQTGTGSGAKGAVRGAAAGAVIGEIADDDAGKGAAWGAALGAVRGRRKGQQAQTEAQQRAMAQEQQRAEVTTGEHENFIKAFSVCLEAKHYMIKY